MADERPDPRTLGTLQRLRMLATDTAIYGIAAAVNKGFALVLFPFLTRNLSVEEYGRLDLALFLAMLLGLAIVWGQDSAVARLFFEDDEEAVRQRIVSQAFLVMTANMAVVALVAFVLLRTPIARETFGGATASMAILLSLFAPISGMISFCQSILKWTFERNKYVVVALGMPAATIAGILLLARNGALDPVRALAVMVGVGACFAALALVMIKRWLLFRPGTDFVRALLPLALPYGALAAISAIVPVMERALVSERFGAEELGLYAAAAKIASLVAMLGIAFQMGWGPFAYSIYQQQNAIRTYNLVLRAFAAIMCVAALAVSAVAEPVTALLAGDRFRGASFFVFPLATAFAVQAIGWITELGIHLSKRPYLNLIGFGFFLAISLGGMFALSQAMGILGVPLGALGGQLAMIAVSAAVAQRARRLAWDYWLPAATILITLASGAAAMVVSGVPAWWFYVGGIVAVVAINILVGFGSDELARTRAILATIVPRARGSDPERKNEAPGPK